MFECFHCGCRTVIWDCDYNYEDFGYEGDAISSVYYGKQYYFREDNGLIYSRDSCRYLTLEDAIYEFAEKFGDDGEV